MALYRASNEPFTCSSRVYPYTSRLLRWRWDMILHRTLGYYENPCSYPLWLTLGLIYGLGSAGGPAASQLEVMFEMIIDWHRFQHGNFYEMQGPCSVSWIKLRLCSATHRPGHWSNLPCDWPSTAWAYSEQETENETWLQEAVAKRIWWNHDEIVT